MSSFRDLSQRIKDYTSGNWEVKVTSGLVRKLYAIDKALACTPHDQQAALEFDQADEEISLSRFKKWAGHSKGDELSKLLDERMPVRSKYRFVWAYEKVYKAALEQRHYVNYDKRGSGKICSDVLQILPKVDDLLGTKLYKRYDQLTSKIQPFRFLELPIQLRMKVYQHLLVSSDTITFPDDISHDGVVIGDTVVPKSQPLCPAVLRTSRQLNIEATQVLYSHNTFFIRSLSRDWTAGGELSLAKMSPAHRALIRKLELQLWHPHDFFRKTAFVKHKAALPSLATLLSDLESCVFLFYENFSLKMLGDRERIREVIEWNVLEAPTAKFVGWDLSFQDEAVKEVVAEAMVRNGGWCYAQSEHWKNHGETMEEKRLKSGVPDYEGYKDDTVISRDFG